MTFKRLSASFSAAPQLTQADVASAAQAGFGAIIDNRPDGEEPGQPSSTEMAAIAKQHGLGFVHIPITPGEFTEADVVRTKAALAETPGPVLGYCRSGARAVTMWALAQVGEASSESLLKAAAEAGYDLSAIKSRLDAGPLRCVWRPSGHQNL